MEMLRAGNRRFVQGKPLATHTSQGMRLELVDQGQAPHTAVIGCADSRAPVESIFDALPGDLFVLRNAGNTCTHAEGSMIGSLEFCIGKLKSRLVVVLGHTKCGAVYGATKTFLAKKTESAAPTSALDGLLSSLSVVAEKARLESVDACVTFPQHEPHRLAVLGEYQSPRKTVVKLCFTAPPQATYDMGPMADEEFVAAHAVKVNVFHTIDYLLQYSDWACANAQDASGVCHKEFTKHGTSCISCLPVDGREARSQIDRQNASAPDMSDCTWSVGQVM
eukprot:Skav222020  [mRNA]  locus=scaffold2914:14060:17425:+ [translate_table: standard]